MNRENKLQLPKSIAQITPSDITDQLNREVTLLEKDYKSRSQGFSPNVELKDRGTSLQNLKLHSHVLRTGEQSIEKTLNEISEPKRADTNKELPLFRNDLASKRWQIIANFIEKIKIYSLKIRFKKTRKSQLDIINDQSFNYDYFYHKEHFEQEKPSLMQKLMYKLENTIYSTFNIDPETSFLIMPDSKVSRIWDTIQFVFLVVYIIYLPIRLAFDALHSQFIPMEVFPNIIQIINMFLEFNTGYYKQGIVITDRKQIFWHYLSKKFIYDLILNICWLISISDGASNWFKAIGLLRVVVIVYLINEIEETFQMREIFGSYFDLFKLGGFIFSSAHFCGCCWYALAIYERNLGIVNTWLDRDIQNYDIEQVVNSTAQGYIASFYWSIVTMCTVGYGDIGPTTYRERIFVMVVVLLSSFVFGFAMNAIGDIIRNLREKSEIFKQQMAVLNIYMKKRSLSDELQRQVRRYYEYLNIERKENNQEGAELLENLAPFLRDEKLISELYKIVKEKKYGVDEWLFKEGDISDKLFLILSGEVQIILQDRVIVQTLREGDFVGQIEFFSNKKYQFSSKTTKFTQIVIIERKEFEQLLTYRCQDFEQLSLMKDNILSYQNTSQIEHRCESCGRYGHMFDSCQLIKLFSNKHRQIYQYNSLQQINRMPWVRTSKTINHISSRVRNNELTKSVQDFITKYNAKMQQPQSQDNSMEQSELKDEYLQTFEDLTELERQDIFDLNLTQPIERTNQPNIPLSIYNYGNQQSPQVDKIGNNQKRKSVFLKLNYSQDQKKNGINTNTHSEAQYQGGSQTTKIDKVLQGILGFEEVQVKFGRDQDVEDGFDQMREYKQYFPNNNSNRVIHKTNAINKKNQIYSIKLRQKRSELRKTIQVQSRKDMIHKRVPSYQKYYANHTTTSLRVKEQPDYPIKPNPSNKQSDDSFYTDNKQLLLQQ